jgi:diguanylate cyclase (GGDEF)-like protein
MTVVERIRNTSATFLMNALFAMPYRLKPNRLWHAARTFVSKLRVHDQLTGLITQREFKVRAARILRTQTSGAVAYLDVDRMVYLNDAMGHSAGDSFLLTVASIVRDCAGDRLVSRFGGDEFVVLADDATQATGIVENVRAAVAARFKQERQRVLAKRQELAGSPVLTISAGLASIRDGQTVQSAIERADSALFDAKRSGRDCVRWVSEAPTA